MSDASTAKKEGSVTVIKGVVKADTAALITNGVESFPEDDFAGSYMAAGSNGFTAILEPFYKPLALALVVQQNNVLSQCVEAMEVNIDGTGHTIDLIDGATESEKEKKRLEDFFNEPYPGKSMVSIRRRIRKDMETTGNGYMEVIRNLKDEVVLINSMAACDLRLIRLDDPVVVEKPVVRDGAEIKVSVRTRERRFVQWVNGKKIYFREFGSSRQVNRNTGDWEKEGETLKLEERGSEILHFIVNEEAHTPYGAPRWLNQLPSALGSRKAEEFNLSYFDAGGLPPVLVMIQGGTLGDGAKEDLIRHLSGGGHRAAVVEAISSSGTLESSGTVQMRVERFGADRQTDSMFQKYDEACEEHVRVGFRIPPMFIGKSKDFNFATARTSYMVAEAQVFGPERTEFDTIINNTIIKALGAKSYHFKSQPVTLTDVDNQLKAMDLISKVSPTDKEEFLSVMNEITNMHVEYKKVDEPLIAMGRVNEPGSLDNSNSGLIKANPLSGRAEPMDAAAAAKLGVPFKDPNAAAAKDKAGATPPPPKTTSNVTPLPVKKHEHAIRIVELANKWSDVLGLNGTQSISKEDIEVTKAEVASLDEEELHLFNEVLVSKNLSRVTQDQEGLGELCACTVEHIKGQA